MYSILILTLNEEHNLPRCLESVRGQDDVVIFDSFSSDRTVEIAKAAGARVIQRTFDNYAAQRNAALTKVTYRHPWVLMLDADECAAPQLHAEIEQVLSRRDDETTLYRMRRKDMFFDRWLRRSSGYPTWFGRLARVGRVRVEREINEEYHTDGKVGWLNQHLIHYPFNKGFNYWLERHNRYSTLEAKALIQETKEKVDWSGVLSRDPVVRRRTLKQIAYRMPGRPLLVFLYLYLFRCGFLDGCGGWAFCSMRSIYEYMIVLKMKELRLRERGAAI